MTHSQKPRGNEESKGREFSGRWFLGWCTRTLFLAVVDQEHSESITRALDSSEPTRSEPISGPLGASPCHLARSPVGSSTNDH